MLLLKNPIFCALIFVFSYSLLTFTVSGQSKKGIKTQNNNGASTDSSLTIQPPDTVLPSVNPTDSITILTSETDTIAEDTSRISPQAIESTITYSATDSIIFFAADKMIHLFGNVVIKYENITLTAEFVEINFETKILSATWMPDSSGNMKGKPIFKENDSWFETYTMKYNFDTKKGYLTNIYTEESEAYLHGKEVKKMSDEVILIKKGSFTTCPDHDPHFEVMFNKAKVIPDDKIVTGPVWLVVEDVPLPLALPFGLFPNKKGRQNGILIPRYGESGNRGFYLEDGGYYFGIKDYADIAIRGDIYSRGSWALKLGSNYKKRYKYDGNLNLSYAFNRIGEPETPEFETSRDMFVVWKHNQDPKAHPKHRFNADVRAGTRDYSRYNPSSSYDYLSSTFSSSVTFSTVFGNNLNFSANLRHSQNKQSKTADMSLPELALSSGRIYPFRKKNRTGKLKIWENVSMNYTMNARNSISSPDSLLFKDWQFRDFDNGVRHQIPISLTQKVLKHFNLTLSANYSQRWYFQSLYKYYDEAADTVISSIDEGFKINHEYQYSAQLQTKLFGMYMYRKGPVSAIRHVVTPQLSFTYRPDFGTSFWGYYRYYYDPDSGEPVRYSIFQDGIYGTSPFGESGAGTISISNNLEMKVRTPKDTINPVKKINLIDDFRVSMTYDVARDSLNWSKLRLSGRTRLFKNIDLSYGAQFDPYIIDSTGRNLNKFEWDVNKKLLRKEQNEWAVSLNWTLNPDIFKKKQTDEKQPSVEKPLKPEENTPITDSQTPELPKVDYSIPWSMNLSYNLRHTRFYGSHILNENKYQITQSLTVNGEINLSPGWKIGMMAEYSFTDKTIPYATVNIYRDLHCWEIIFNWIPTGFRKSYNFTLRVKAPMLQDLKIRKRTDWRDFY
jgi:hypothetical protein